MGARGRRSVACAAAIWIVPAVATAQPEVRLADVTDRAGLAFDSGPSQLLSTTAAGDALVPSWLGAGVAVGDYDRDGDLDLYLLANLGTANRLFRNESEPGELRFVEATPPALADTGQGRVAHFADLGGDRNLDLVLVNDDSPEDGSVSRIFRGDGRGGFRDVTNESGFAPLGYAHGGASLIDYDLDGKLDIYVTNWGSEIGKGEARLPGYNRLYRNLGDFRFREVTEEVGLGRLARDSFTPVFGQFDSQPGADLYVAVDHTRDAFYRRTEDGFDDASSEVGVLHEASDMGVAGADYDDDGDLDMFTSNVYRPSHPIVPSENALYENRLEETGELAFVDRAAELGVDNTLWGWGTQWVDVDGDADLDLVVVNGFREFVEYFPEVDPELATGPEALFLREPDGFRRFEGTALDQELDARALVAFDADRDGDRDLLVTTQGGPAHLLENRTVGHGHTVTVVLQPATRASSAVVYGSVDGVRKRRDVLTARSYLAGAPPEVTFGLGEAEALENAEVIWADGRRSSLGTVEAGTLVRLRRCTTGADCAGPCGEDGLCAAPPQTGDDAGTGGCLTTGAQRAPTPVALALLAFVIAVRRRTRGSVAHRSSTS